MKKFSKKAKFAMIKSGVIKSNDNLEQSFWDMILKDCETQWTEKKVSQAYTIGFLQGGIKFLIQELKQNSQN